MKLTSEQEMLNFGKKFAEDLIKNGNLNAIIELIGDVGAGKTTFTRGLAMGLGITKPVTSPSFTVSKSYAFNSNHTLTHYDFYRLDNPGLMSDDLQDSIKNGHLVIVEWAATVKNFLPDNRIKITITLNDDGSRNVKVSQNSQQPYSPSRPSAKDDENLRDAEMPSNSQQAYSRPSAVTTRSVEETRRQDEVSLRPSATNDERIERLSPVTTGAKERAEKRPILPSLSLYLDTSSPVTILRLNDHEYTWESRNTLAEKLLEFIHDKLQENHATWQDITKITFMSGPGSFTGLRIGASIVNALSHELNIPLYDHHGNKHPVILPEYGREANITKPKK